MVEVAHADEKVQGKACGEKTLIDEFCNDTLGCGTDFICLYDDLCDEALG